MMHPALHRPLAIVVVLASFVSTSACQNERSVDAFCSTMRSEKDRILGKFGDVEDAADASGDEFVAGLIQLGGSIAVIGELRTYFAKLADAAPEEIRPQAEIVRDAFSDQLDSVSGSMDNPLGGLAAAFFSSLTTSGQMNDLHEWAKSNCGEGI